MAQKVQLLIKNATYYANGVFLKGHILVNDGKIVGLMAELPEVEAAKTIDAKGKYVLPGIVDSHVHFRDPGRTDREDFFTGSRAAVAGGVTTICEMPIAYPPVHSVEILQNRIDIANEKCITDFAFYGAAGFENRNSLQDLVDKGVCAFKTFLHPAPAGREGEFVGLTVNDDGQLFMMLREAAKTGARFTFHCENYKLIEEMEKYLHETCQNDYSFHYKSRPNIAETESVATIIQFAKATGAKVGIVHMSAPEACELVKQAQAEGVDIIGETCFHYLSFDTTDIDAKGPYAKCNPPLRTAEDVEKLWGYVLDGTITYLGSDHAPFTKEEKEIGVREGIWRAYSGMPAIETFLPIMLT
ncbi:MAG: amidohydrolase family protein, partial [Clostridia bacterium]|nr:amidohydrolase family protein [Clostridia bacterium]